jgi:hypothetical protein
VEANKKFPRGRCVEGQAGRWLEGGSSGSGDGVAEAQKIGDSTGVEAVRIGCRKE